VPTGLGCSTSMLTLSLLLFTALRLDVDCSLPFRILRFLTSPSVSDRFVATFLFVVILIVLLHAAFTFVTLSERSMSSRSILRDTRVRDCKFQADQSLNSSSSLSRSLFLFNPPHPESLAGPLYSFKINSNSQVLMPVPFSFVPCSLPFFPFFPTFSSSSATEDVSPNRFLSLTLNRIS